MSTAPAGVRLCNCPFDTSLEHLDTVRKEPDGRTVRYCGICRGFVSGIILEGEQ